MTQEDFLGRGHGRHKPGNCIDFRKVRGQPSSDPARVGRVCWEGWVGHEEEGARQDQDVSGLEAI